MNDQMRKDFEAWWESACQMECDDKYGSVRDGWEIWQAATLAERERCALVCESISNEARKDWKAHYKAHDDGRSDGAFECAEAIRQRS